ncbi:hypothetical protein V8E53_011887 [Lactarius tabidus]
MASRNYVAMLLCFFHYDHALTPLLSFCLCFQFPSMWSSTTNECIRIFGLTTVTAKLNSIKPDIRLRSSKVDNDEVDIWYLYVIPECLTASFLSLQAGFQGPPSAKLLRLMIILNPVLYAAQILV